MSAPALRVVLLAIVFTTGAAVLMVEVTATRVLAPHFGTTIYMLSSVIGVILAALSCGYWAGGRLADRAASLAVFFHLILASGISLIVIDLLIAYVLRSFSARLPLISGPPLAATILFFVPSFLLGMLSPYAIKLLHVHAPQRGIGSTAGGVFFWSTLGSIVGTFLAGFYLIPNVGVGEIILAIGLVLCALGLIGAANASRRRSRLPEMLLIIILSLAAWAVTRAGLAGIVHAEEGIYQSIFIIDKNHHGRPIRYLYQDRNPSGTMYLDTRESAHPYASYYALYQLFKNADSIKHALVIGGGAYLVPLNLLRDLPHVQVDTVEIEPSLVTLAEEYFALPHTPRHRPFTADGRRFLQQSDVRYDFIFGDPYYSYYTVPAHLATVEFFQLVADRLTDEGVFIANVVGSLTPDDPSFALSEMRTFLAVFPNSYFFALESPVQPDPQNIIFVGYKGTARVDVAAQSRTAGGDSLLHALPAQQIDLSRLKLTTHPLLTDNFAPTDYLAAQVAKQLAHEQ